MIALSIFSLIVIASTNKSSSPIIINASVEPYKVIPGDIMLISAEITDYYGIKERKNYYNKGYLQQGRAL